MVGEYTVAYGGLLGITNVGFSLVVLVIVLYYIKSHSKLDELSRRFLFSGFFLGIHQVTFFLGDDFIYALTNTLFFISLFYSLIYIVRHNTVLNKKLEEHESSNTELKNRLDELKKEIT